MSPDRSLFERALQRVVPRPVADHAPPPREVCTGLWILERRLRHFGAALLPSQTTIVRLAGGSLVVISPPPALDSHSVSAIERIGRVEYVVIPNSFHYLYASEFMKHHPAASVLAPPGLAERVPDLEFDSELGTQPPEAWSGTLEHLVLGPVRGVSEVLFFHAPSGTLILTDLAFNMSRYPRPVDRLLWRLSGIPRKFGPGRTTRTLLLRDRAVASRVLVRAMDWPIRRIVVAHGDVLEQDAASRFQSAFSRVVTAG